MAAVTTTASGAFGRPLHHAARGPLSRERERTPDFRPINPKRKGRQTGGPFPISRSCLGPWAPKPETAATTTEAAP